MPEETTGMQADQEQREGQVQEETKTREAQAQAQDREREQLQARIAELEAQVGEYLDRLQHLQADFENYKKRVAREWEERRRAIEDGIILEFIPIYDNMERAFASLDHQNREAFIEGIKQIFAQFQQVLEKLEVKRIAAAGARFDPAFHEAVLRVEEEGEPNVVVQELEPGYLRAGRLLRPSLVAVRKSPEPEAPQSQKQKQGQEQSQEREREKEGAEDG